MQLLYRQTSKILHKLKINVIPMEAKLIQRLLQNIMEMGVEQCVQIGMNK